MCILHDLQAAGHQLQPILDLLRQPDPGRMKVTWDKNCSSPLLQNGYHIRQYVSWAWMAYSETLIRNVHEAGATFLRTTLPLALSLALCNMDRIVLSVAIVPIAQEFGFSIAAQAWHAMHPCSTNFDGLASRFQRNASWSMKVYS